jgi:hypothetical protein
MGIVAFDKFSKWHSAASKKAVELVSRFKSKMNVPDALMPPDFEKQVAKVLYESEKFREQYKGEHGSGN